MAEDVPALSDPVARFDPDAAMCATRTTQRAGGWLSEAAAAVGVPDVTMAPCCLVVRATESYARSNSTAPAGDGD